MLSLGSGNVNSGNVTNSYNTTVNNTTVTNTDAEDSQIKKWISPLEPQHRHEDVRTNRVAGVGDWFLETDRFREWSGSQGVSERVVLFCYGDPGMGKTNIRSVRKLSRAVDITDGQQY